MHSDPLPYHHYSISETLYHIIAQYTSDPVSLSVAEAVLTTIEVEKLQDSAREVGTYLINQFKSMMDKYHCIGDVR